jgi:hypothetical protein
MSNTLDQDSVYETAIAHELGCSGEMMFADHAKAIIEGAFANVLQVTRTSAAVYYNVRL